MGAQRKTIRSVMQRKLTDWINSIDDKQLRDQVRLNCFVTGGAIVSLLQGDTPKDFDVYFRTKEVAKAVAQYYVDKYVAQNPDAYIFFDQGAVHEYGFTNLNGEHETRIGIKIDSAGVAGDPQAGQDSSPSEKTDHDDVDALAALIGMPSEDAQAPAPVEKGPYHPTFISQNAVTLSDKIQLITRFYGEPADIHKNYDFIHCQNYYVLKDNELVLLPLALEAVLSQTLVYTGSLYPICSILRTRKFLQRGWKINAGQLLKMAMQCSKVDFKDVSVLQDQLTGCDSHYFAMLIRALNEAPETSHDDDGRLSQSYVVEIIDRVFNA